MAVKKHLKLEKPRFHELSWQQIITTGVHKIQDSQCTYNVTLRRVLEAIVAVEKQ
jgi:hypothetical protein